MGLTYSTEAPKKKKKFPRTAEDKRFDEYTKAFVYDKPYKKTRSKYTVVDISRGKPGSQEKRKVLKNTEQLHAKHPPSDKPIELKKIVKPPKSAAKDDHRGGKKKDDSSIESTERTSRESSCSYREDTESSSPEVKVTVPRGSIDWSPQESVVY